MSALRNLDEFGHSRQKPLLIVSARTSLQSVLRTWRDLWLDVERKIEFLCCHGQKQLHTILQVHALVRISYVRAMYTNGDNVLFKIVLNEAMPM